jgi:hypothetical protein
MEMICFQNPTWWRFIEAICRALLVGERRTDNSDSQSSKIQHHDLPHTNTTRHQSSLPSSLLTSNNSLPIFLTSASSTSSNAFLTPSTVSPLNPALLWEYTSTPAGVKSVFAKTVTTHLFPVPGSCPYPRTSQCELAIFSQPLPRQSHSPLLSPEDEHVSIPRRVCTLGPERDWYVTRSSMRSVVSSEIEGLEGGRGVYWIRTLRLLFHMGSVECVTCHVSVNQAMLGD